ncbi:putative quorum-sensing-regulated virulence factor [Acinetobacter dispersus]|uniref:Exonuclease domain-containing protein n=1 Tax=Acinetobacter dispersus TaxID=70348 RepID=N9L937_9GAMM|nr:DUF3820 family protein [Acinetobacter dispersus]ENW92792.1 hypothetical protein F904_02735 [Acinetobacter dispersus]
MNAIILDTETNTLHGLPIEIAHVPFTFMNGEARIFGDRAFEQRYTCNQPISHAAMAVHHILETDLVGMPFYKSFQLPQGVEYIIGHNIDYDLAAIAQCGIDTTNIKAICTLALAREAWPTAESHNISALIYMLMEGSVIARQRLREAHNAKADVMLTAFILKSITRELNITNLEDLYLASENARIPKIMPVGKYKGTPIKNLPADYVAWFLKQSDVKPFLRKALENRG